MSVSGNVEGISDTISISSYYSTSNSDLSKNRELQPLDKA